MYSFVKNKSLIKNIESFGSTLIKDLIKRINKQKYIRVQKELFGSGSEELIVQNDKGVIIIDYNLIVYAFFEGNSLYDCKKIREFVKKNFDESLTQLGCEISKDHSLSLTAENLTIDDYKDTPFIINLILFLNLDQNIEFNSHILKNQMPKKKDDFDIMFLIQIL
ncbi:Uncharacterised protein (plasmid) [Mycoplasmopsis fermentans]|nr:Uncharacterised protein [Mycoplasmopsis fermentans]